MSVQPASASRASVLSRLQPVESPEELNKRRTALVRNIETYNKGKVQPNTSFELAKEKGYVQEFLALTTAADGTMYETRAREVVVQQGREYVKRGGNLDSIEGLTDDLREEILSGKPVGRSIAFKDAKAAFEVASAAPVYRKEDYDPQAWILIDAARNNRSVFKQSKDSKALLVGQGPVKVSYQEASILVLQHLAEKTRTLSSGKEKEKLSRSAEEVAQLGIEGLAEELRELGDLIIEKKEVLKNPHAPRGPIERELNGNFLALCKRVCEFALEVTPPAKGGLLSVPTVGRLEHRIENLNVSLKAVKEFLEQGKLFQRPTGEGFAKYLEYFEGSASLEQKIQVLKGSIKAKIAVANQTRALPLIGNVENARKGALENAFIQLRQEIVSLEEGILRDFKGEKKVEKDGQTQIEKGPRNLTHQGYQACLEKTNALRWSLAEEVQNSPYYKNLSEGTKRKVAGLYDFGSKRGRRQTVEDQMRRASAAEEKKA